MQEVPARKSSYNPAVYYIKEWQQNSNYRPQWNVYWNLQYLDIYRCRLPSGWHKIRLFGAIAFPRFAMHASVWYPGAVVAQCYRPGLQVNRPSDRSCTWGMIPTKIHHISLGCFLPSIALQCRIVSYSSIYSFILYSILKANCQSPNMASKRFNKASFLVKATDCLLV